MAEPPPLTVLNVNDDEPTRYALSRILRHAGFAVCEAGTGAEALVQARQHPDLILLDVQLPDVDGFEVCRRLKAEATLADIPVVHLSAHFTHSDDKAQGLETGADAYLVHPVEPRELVATVRAMVRIRNAEAQARTLARQWQSTFDGIRDAVVVLDTAGVILRGNRAAAELLGQAAERLAGQSYRDVLQRQFRADAARFLHFPAARARYSAEQHVGDRWLRILTDPLADEHGATTGYVQIVADVTDQKRREQTERELYARQLQVEQLRSEVARLEVLSEQFPGQAG